MRVCLQNPQIVLGRELISSTNSLPQSTQTRKVFRALYIAVISNQGALIAFFVIDCPVSMGVPSFLRCTLITNNQGYTALFTAYRCTAVYPPDTAGLRKHKKPQSPSASACALRFKYCRLDPPTSDTLHMMDKNVQAYSAQNTQKSCRRPHTLKTDSTSGLLGKFFTQTLIELAPLILHIISGISTALAEPLPAPILLTRKQLTALLTPLNRHQCSS